MTLSSVRLWLLSCASALLPAMADGAVSCSVSATGPVFGIYNPLSATPTYANGQVQASCTLLSGGATTVNIVSSYSTGASGTYTLRDMLSGANKLGYNLFFDAAYTQIRGDGTGGSQTGGATLSLNNGNPTQSATSTIYGRIPAGQDVAAGAYADTIVVTITY
jgi:spore coat protein U-like protein